MRGRSLLAFSLVITAFGALVQFLLIKSVTVVLGVVCVAVAGTVLLRRWAPTLLHEGLAVFARERLATGVALGVAAVSFPLLFHAQPYWVHIATMGLLYGVMVLGLNIHLGEIGAINVGYAGFFAIGAYTAAILGVNGVSFWLTLLAAPVAAYVAGLLLGACLLRTSGDYLALVTLGFGLIVYQLIINLPWLTHGTDGIRNIPVPALWGHRFQDPVHLGVITLNRETNYYWLTLAFLALSAVVVHRLKSSWVGRVWAGLRQDPIATSCFGVNLPLVRLWSFGFGASFGGLAGAIYAYKTGFVGPEDFTLLLSITLVSMVILGGMGNWKGVVAGAMILVFVPEKLREFQDYRLLVYGLVLILLLIYRPHGLFPDVQRRYQS